MSLQTTITQLLNQNLPFSLDWLPSQSYLVGGAIRDAILGREREQFDLDFVIADRAVAIARKIAYHYHAGFVVLDEARQIARLVFDRGTIDIAQREGDSLETDLARRDFTINAIAYDLDTQTLVDPFSGLQDLQLKSIRMISVQNLKDDPLRLLRAYRQAAQLNLTIETNTRSSIATLAPLIAQIAAERVQTEINYLLSSSLGSQWLTAAWQDGLLAVWFEQATAEKLQQLVNLDKSIEVLSDLCPQLNDLGSWWIAVAKLATLVSSAPAAAELELVKLKYPRADIKAITNALTYLPKLKILTTQMSLREQYFFFLHVKNNLPVLALLAVNLGADLKIITPLLDRYFDSQDLVAHPQALITGKDLLENLKLTASPKIGELLTAIQIARIEGKIGNADEAIEFARSLL